MTTQIKVDSDFIRIALQMREAQKEEKHSPSPRTKRRAESLQALFDAKLSKIKGELDAAEKPAESGQAMMFDLKKVN